MSEKLGNGRLPSVKDKYEAAVEAENAKREVNTEETKVESKPRRKNKDA